MSSSESEEDSSEDEHTKVAFTNSKEHDLLKNDAIKKRNTTVSHKVAKPAGKSNVVNRKLRSSNQNGPARREFRPARPDRRHDSSAFYRGALLGSFLGATLTTAVSNLIAKALQGN